ncbi:hypothetical protein HOLleu_39878 [Holothuria leucospilota]|uniref:Uncharacterized protein n=1 Tax=Holothuria leucospilota TaxID=206669 RepID=A0A9Q1BCD5_HOLLE|nr:hypothetical protein HOLleu_39878 [Holothuria leucospilota]
MFLSYCYKDPNDPSVFWENQESSDVSSSFDEEYLREELRWVYENNEAVNGNMVSKAKENGIKLHSSL